MNTELLISALSSIYELSKEYAEYLLKHVRQEEKPRHSLLWEAGERPGRIYFIVKGIARGYYLKESQTVTTWFLKEEDFILCINSFNNRQPAMESVELLENSILLSLAFNELRAAYELFPESNYIARVIHQRYGQKADERTQLLRIKTVSERYEWMWKHERQLFERVNLGHIASYMNIAAETLSRLRAGKAFF